MLGPRENENSDGCGFAESGSRNALIEARQIQITPPISLQRRTYCWCYFPSRLESEYANGKVCAAAFDAGNAGAELHTAKVLLALWMCGGQKFKLERDSDCKLSSADQTNSLFTELSSLESGC
jgi:hypothetical protein